MNGERQEDNNPGNRQENKNMKQTKLWQKGYKLNADIESFTVGNDYLLDKRLVKYDCIASIAHAKMLSKIGILSDDEAKRLVKELNKIIDLDKKGKFIIRKEDEDCHTAIENHLTKKLGDIGKKIHTGRSRNDQVLTALRLYYKDQILEVESRARGLVDSMIAFVKEYGNIRMPGYTHTRKAMPSSAKMWGEAIIDSIRDDLMLLDAAKKTIDQSPLGGGAGYGVPLNLDREYTAKELGFLRVQNPIYSQNSRGKFESTILHALGQIMLDLNRASSDLIMFSMPEFGFFELPKEFCTGSSIMPQKKNPDALELIRAKYHVILSLEMQLKSMTADLISGYHRDLQLTKEPIMNGFDITNDCLKIFTLIITGTKVSREACEKAMTKELFAAEEAYNLVRKGIPFREAYQQVSKRF